MKWFIYKALKTGMLFLLCLWLSLPGDVIAQKIQFTGKDNSWMAVHTNYVDGTTSRQVGYFYLDTSIVLHGVAYKALAESRHSNSYVIQLLVREDTVTGKVYFKSWDRNGFGNGTYIKDTAEFVAYDYGLNIGDTLIMPLVYYGYGATSMHILKEKDSVKINGIWHIAQRFTCPFGFGRGGSSHGYDVVEGVGSLTNPVNPTPTTNFENTFNLTCFSNGDTLSPSEVRLSFPLIASWGRFHLASFSSCMKLDIAERTLPGVAWKMSPNPAREEVIVDLETHTAEVYDLYIHDVLGKVLYAGTIKRRLRIPLSSWAPGYYLVTLADAKGRRSIQKLAVQ